MSPAELHAIALRCRRLIEVSGRGHPWIRLLGVDERPGLRGDGCCVVPVVRWDAGFGRCTVKAIALVDAEGRQRLIGDVRGCWAAPGAGTLPGYPPARLRLFIDYAAALERFAMTGEPTACALTVDNLELAAEAIRQVRPDCDVLLEEGDR